MSDKRQAIRNTVVKSSTADAARELERLIAKEKYKDAVKQAKLIHKAEPTPENHRQLERAYFFRAQQLLRTGMPDSAIEVSRHLLEFGVTDTKLVEEFAPLLVKLGLVSDAYRIQGRCDSPEIQSRLQVIAADQAVLHPERSQRSSPQFQDAAHVRQAIEALHAGDESKALELVRDIARISPLSDWKLLVRGLAAYYRGDRAETEANWSRLDPERAAKRIASRLQSLNETRSAKDVSEPDFEKLERLVYGEPILPRLRELKDLVAKSQWDDVLRRITGLRLKIREVDPQLDEKLTSCLMVPLIQYVVSADYATGIRVLREFTRLAAPTTIDPSWNRLWAMCWDRQGTPEAISFWTKYATDLISCTALKPEERPLAQALVWSHIAKLYLGEIQYRCEYGEDDDFDEAFDDIDYEEVEGDPSDRDEDRLEQQARTCIERSLELAPRHRPTYELLVDLYDMTDEPEKLSATQQRILEIFPDDVETLVDVAIESHDRGEPAAALEALSRARKHKPLDEVLVEQELMVRTALALSLALQKRWDEGRAQFTAIEQLRPDKLRSFSHLARRAIFETKASQGELADRYEREAAALLPEPASLFLVLRAESVRYKLSKATQKQYGELWNKELRKKCRSETAGAMASYWAENVNEGSEYEGSDRDAIELLKYLRRTSRLNYRLEDVESVCEFLGGFPQEDKLTRSLVSRGLKAYPESVLLHVVAAAIDLKKPSLFWGAGPIIKHLQEALRIAETSTRPKETRMLPRIKEMLSVTNELSERMSRFAFSARGSSPGPSGKPGKLDESFMNFLGSFMSEEAGEEEPEDHGGSRAFGGRGIPGFARTGRKDKP